MTGTDDSHHHAGAPLPKSKAYRGFLIGVGMLQITLGSGLIVGWAAIAGSMLVASLENGGAGLTLDQTTQIFGIAASVNYVAPLFMGLVLDNYGPRACSVASNALVALGCLVFGMSTTFSTITLASCLIAFGGPAVQTSLMHIGNLYPERRFFVMGVVAESITLSFAILPLMDVVWEANYPNLGYRPIFSFWAVVVALSAMASFVLWPDAPYQVIDVPKVATAIKANDADEPDEGSGLLKDTKPPTTATIVDLKHASLSKQVSSGVYLRLGIFFIVTAFWANFYIATVTVELADQHVFDPEMQHSFARWLSFIDAGAIVIAPFSGYMLDSVGFIETALFAVAMGVLQQVLLLVAGESASVMVGSFVAYAVFRSFLFPYFFGSLSRRLGFRYFGILTGIAFSTSGVTQLLISPLAGVVQGTCHTLEEGDILLETVDGCSQGHWRAVHWLQIATVLSLVLIPFLDNYYEKKNPAPPDTPKFSVKASLRNFSLRQEYGSLYEDVLNE